MPSNVSRSSIGPIPERQWSEACSRTTSTFVCMHASAQLIAPHPADGRHRHAETSEVARKLWGNMFVRRSLPVHSNHTCQLNHTNSRVSTPHSQLTAIIIMVELMIVEPHTRHGNAETAHRFSDSDKTMVSRAALILGRPAHFPPRPGTAPSPNGMHRGFLSFPCSFPS